MNIKRKIENKISRGLELPEEVISDRTKISLTGNSFLKIVNYKSLVEYETTVIRINTPDNLIRIDGENLFINSVTDESVEISGEIEKIIFE